MPHQPQGIVFINYLRKVAHNTGSHNTDIIIFFSKIYVIYLKKILNSCVVLKKNS
jgi:hypothetical protein